MEEINVKSTIKKQTHPMGNMIHPFYWPGYKTNIATHLGGLSSLGTAAPLGMFPLKYQLLETLTNNFHQFAAISSEIHICWEEK